MDLILRAATRAATAGNLQPYSLVVIDDRDLLAKSPFPQVPAAIVALVDLYRIKRWLDLNDAPFHWNQPSNLFISFWDATIALQNAVVAAESLGLGTLYIGGVLSQDMSEFIGAPEYTLPAGLVLLGHPDEAPELRPRLPMDAVLHRNAYRRPSDEEIRAWYREVDLAFERKSNEEKERLGGKGIRNRAQQLTIGHYTPELIARESRGVLANVKRAGFRFSVDDAREEDA
jgi:hypothetical protein